MNLLLLERAGALVGAVFAIRLVAGWRVARRQRTALVTPLVDPVLLETLFAPRAGAGDDANLLAEMRDTFLHLNRRAYAEEFWGLHRQLMDLYQRLGEPQRVTMRRALVRLIEAEDRWLQVVGAKASAELHVPEAIPALGARLQPTPSDSSSASGAGPLEPADERFRQELERALATLQEADVTEIPGKAAP